MIQAGGYQFVEPPFVEWQARGDQVDVEICRSGGFDEGWEIGTGEWFAAGEIQLHDAERGGFAEDPEPDLGRKFVGAGGEVSGIGAVDAVQRAAVGEFGDERKGIWWSWIHWSISSTNAPAGAARRNG